MMTGRLSGKVAIVTGAGSIGDGWGNGKACAVLYAREGAKVVLVDRNLPAAEETRAIIESEGGSAVAVECDASTAEGVDAFVTAATESFGGVDILHNNVGIGIVKPLLESDEKSWDLVFRVNVKSFYLAMQRAIPVMRTRGGGSIINISSIASIRWTGVKYASYSASKAAVNQLTQVAALEHAADNIRINALLLGYIDTPTVYAGQTDPTQESKRLELARRRIDACPLGRMGTAWDVANASLFLASDESSYITGALINLDGGLSVVADR
jgi:NAD(P)-dependent dehydrogenase (short-subunit alcohol dehydrogenase family)